MNKLKRILQEDYKVGAESTSQTQVIYIDPDNLDLLKVIKETREFERKNIELANLIEESLKGGYSPSEMDKKAIEKAQVELAAAQANLVTSLASLMAEHLDAQFTGISTLFKKEELATLLADSLKLGPFASNPENGLVCIINKPTGNDYNQDTIYSTYAITFKAEHMRPFPGSTALIKEFVGVHEGEHCNQEIIFRKDPEANFKLFLSEVGADIAAIKFLRQMGQHDTAQGLIDIRALTAARGDYTHATSIFLDKPGFQLPTKEHFEAARAFKQEMINAVAAQSGMNTGDVAKLRTDDPQRFVKIVEQALEAGKIPAPKIKELWQDERKDLIAQDLGLTRADFDALSPDKIPDIMKSYDKLQAAGAFTKNETNPFIRDYVESYVGAVKRLVIPDTTPKVNPTVTAAATATPPAEPPKPTPKADAPPKEQQEPEVTTEQRVSNLTAKDHLKDAEENYQSIMKTAIAERLEISEDDAQKLMDADDPAAFAALEEMIREDKISSALVMQRSDKEIDEILAKNLSVSVDDLPSIDRAKLSVAMDLLERSNAFVVEYNNPYILDRIKQHIDEHHKTNKTGPHAETSPTAAALGHSDYFVANPMPKDGAPQIVYGATGSQTFIGGASASAYFFSFADPALAEQRITNAALTGQFTLTAGQPRGAAPISL